MHRNVSFFVFFLLLRSPIGVPAQEVSTTKPNYCYSYLNEQKPIYIAWKCDQRTNKCSRLPSETAEREVECATSLNVCNLLCNEHGSLWPFATIKTYIKRSLLSINPGSIAFTFQIPESADNLWQILQNLETYFLNAVTNKFDKRSKLKQSDGLDLRISFSIRDKDSITFAYNISESYTLKIESDNSGIDVKIEAESYLGARHGAETLLQLIVFDEISNSLLIPSQADISDAPAYKHRGILLDTSRNYYTIKSIKRMLDAMAQNKLNTFHWHIIDSHSFPFVSKTYPEMTAYGAYTSSQIYTWSDIRNIVEYARVRGVRVVPELDTPAHLGEGWQHFGTDVMLCFKGEPWQKFCAEPPCGLLNPVNERVYEILSNLYSEFNQLFDSDIFHMGGDEIKYVCWNETESIVNWLTERKLNREENNFLHLWGAFQAQALTEFDKSVNRTEKPKIVLWTSLLTENKLVKEILDPNRYIIQVWTKGNDKQIVDLLNDGYELIMSNYDALYFDCGFGAWIGEGNNWCSPYIGWQKVYDNNFDKIIIDLQKTYEINSANPGNQILGAEATLWSEQSDSNTLDSRLWPRAAAFAERLWSNPSTNWTQAENRLLTQRERMVARNIGADVVGPLWCHHNEGLCYN